MNQNVQAHSGQILKILGKQKAVIAIVAIFFLMMFPDTSFYTTANLFNLMEAVSTNAIIAFGVTFAVICKGCDLSVGSVMAMSGIVAILLINEGMTTAFASTYSIFAGIILCVVLAIVLVKKGLRKLYAVLLAIGAGVILRILVFEMLMIIPMNMAIAIALAILAGTIVGFFNGFLIVHQKTEAFIITLGMGMLIQGVALMLTDAVNVSARNPDFQRIANDNWLFIPNIAAFMIILLVLTFLLLRFTNFGRNVYALGGDYEVAEHSGINVVRTKWIAFVITGTFAAIAGILAASRMNTGMPIAGVEIPLMVNCGVVLGGTSFAGGVGGAFRSFIGIFLLFLISNSLGMLGIEPFQQQLVRGIIIVLIISLDCFAIKRRKEAV